MFGDLWHYNYMSRNKQLGTADLISLFTEKGLLDEHDNVRSSKLLSSSDNIDVYRIVLDPYDDGERLVFNRAIVVHENGAVRAWWVNSNPLSR